jgi:hypothetical protein
VIAVLEPVLDDVDLDAGRPRIADGDPDGR